MRIKIKKNVNYNNLYPELLIYSAVLERIKLHNTKLYKKIKDADYFEYDNSFFYRIYDTDSILRISYECNHQYIFQLVMNILSCDADAYAEILGYYAKFRSLYIKKQKDDKKNNKNKQIQVI